MKIVLIGIQGAGKSTQGNLLSTHLDVPYLSSGHVFREMAKEKTQLGRYVKETLNAGILIPDDMTINIMNEYLSKGEYKKGYILDGFPRTEIQAEQFSNGVDAVVFLDVSDKEALWRISGRVSDREDETLQAIRKRIELFHTFTQPVVQYYEKQGKLINIDGEMSVDHIFKDILAKLEKLESK
ncbi:MAG: nucleoside monophosphate kinase [Patescibacteria group bacterium]